MNTAGYILIVAILVLGGVLATAGDRIGTKVGKARLSLFNLRPKKTATLVTIVTGITISASTFGILFATSEPLRKGIFEYDRIQERLKTARKELEQTRRQLNQTQSENTNVQDELSRAKSEQALAQKRLDETNQSLQTTLAELDKRLTQQAQTQANLDETQQKLDRVETNFQQKRAELESLQAERQALIERIEEGKAQINRRDREIAIQEREIVQRDRAIAQQEGEIAQQEQQLSERERQLAERNQKLAQQEQQLVEREKLLTERDRLLAERDQKLAELDQLLAERDQKLAERNQKLAERDRLLAERNQKLAERDRLLAERETRLQELETQKTFIEGELQFLERDLQVLKEGTIVLRRNQVLASGVVRILQPAAARSAVEQLLREANQAAIKLTQPGTENFQEQMVQITQAEVEELINQINDGQDYVVRILSAANYLLGENQVEVFANAARNRVVFLPGDVVAATSIDPTTMREEQIRERIELLLAASTFRSRGVGIMTDTIQVGDGRIETLIRFLDRLRAENQSVDVKALAAEVTYTSGPLKINLVVLKDGKVAFQT